MIIYNITVKIDDGIAGLWLHWMLHEQGPQILATGCFNSFKILQLLDVDDTEGPTYAVQYITDTIKNYQQYVNEFDAEFRQLSYAKWGNRFAAYHTIMKAVN